MTGSALLKDRSIVEPSSEFDSVLKNISFVPRSANFKMEMHIDNRQDILGKVFRMLANRKISIVELRFNPEKNSFLSSLELDLICSHSQLSGAVNDFKKFADISDVVFQAIL